MPDPEPQSPLDQNLPDWRPLSDVAPSEWEGGRGVDPDDNVDEVEGGEQPIFKPHPFAVTFGDGGAKIVYGELLYGVTIQTVTRTQVSGTSVVESITQNPIEETKKKVPEYNGTPLNPEIPNIYTQLDGYGDIYLYWEYDLGAGGAITVCEIRVGLPGEQDIAMLDADLTRDGSPAGVGCSGKYAIKLATINEGAAIQQFVGSDVPWFVHIINDDLSSCSETSDSSSAGSSSAAPSSSSSKSSCIIDVPTWFHSTGYTALFIMEAPEVRFEDFMQVEVAGRITRVPVDPRFVIVCEPGTLQVRSVTGTKPARYGAWVGHDGYLYIDSGIFWWLKKGTVNVSVTGIRRGFLHSSHPDNSFYDTRFPSRTAAQFLDNEKFINQAYSQEHHGR